MIFSLYFRHSINGDVTVSFPASAISSLSSSDDPPILTFAITGSTLLEHVLPNKALIMRYSIIALARKVSICVEESV